MAAILALLPGVIALIPTISSGVQSIIALVNSIRKAAQQSGEWTPDLDRQFMDALIATATDPKWQSDPKV